MELPVEHTDPLIGRTLAGRYRIIRLIAAGGMGRVYEVEQEPLGRRVALKILTLHQNRFGTTGGFSSTDPSARRAEGSRKRFLLEASSCAKLTHPNTITVFDFGETDDNVSYIAMELLEGKTLRQAMNAAHVMDPARAIHISAQICASLREAHSHNVVHRDLKPGNVFLIQKDDDPDYVKVLDFGIVKAVESEEQDLTETGSTVGSPRYMAPEQILNKNVDGRADVYAIGVLMFEMLTGRVPFDCHNAMETMLAHLQVPPPTLSVARPDLPAPPVLERIVEKALKKDPDERFESVGALHEALTAAAQELSLSFPVKHLSGPRGRPTFNLGEAPGPTVELSVDDVPIPTPWATRALLAAAVLFLSGAGVALFWSGTGDGAAEETRPETVSINPALTPPAPEAVTPEPAPPEPAVAVSVAVNSRPDGARVLLAGEEVCDTTPCTLELRPDETVSLLFRRAGYLPVELEHRVTAGESIDVKLRAIPAKRKPKRKAKEAVPKGYKANPYD